MITLVHPYYNHKETFAYQLRQWEQFSDNAKKNIEIIVVDDGSPEFPCNPPKTLVDLKVFRIKEDIIWNTAGSANLGAKEAKYDWIMHVDFDLGLNAKNADKLLKLDFNNPKVVYWPMTWHETSRGFQKYGQPHCNGFLMNKKTFWEAGGFDEDFSGCWGGQDIMFHLVSCPPLGLEKKILENIVLERMVRCSDAKVKNVYRDREDSVNWKKFYDKRDGLIPQSTNILRFKWEQVYP